MSPRIPRTNFLSALSTAALLVASNAAQAEVLPRFPAGAVWNQDISSATVHPNSTSMISTLSGLGGFGNGRMQIDFSIYVLQAAAGAPTQPVIDPDARGYYLPDCEPLGSTIPLPPGGATEGSPTDDYACDNANNDCHVLVVQGNLLYEAYSANLTPAGLDALCLAVWNLGVVYPPEGRGEHCTSADAAGFPMAPLLFNADEVFAALQKPPTEQHLGHAIRFILPNARMASDALPGAVSGRLYVRPASHAGAPSGPAGSVPYGSRLRLRADFPFTNYSPSAQVILRTLQKYGMVLADGGNIALTAESDRFTIRKWNDPAIGLDPNTGGSRVFDQTAGATVVAISDFEVMDTGPRIAETYDCVRTTIPLDSVFQDGFES